MSFPKWRHHPVKESMIVWDEGVEASQTPTEGGWRDDRNFSPITNPIPIQPALVVEISEPKKRGRKPRV